MCPDLWVMDDPTHWSTFKVKAESREVLVDACQCNCCDVSEEVRLCRRNCFALVVLPLEKYGRRRNLTNAAAEKVVEGKNGENGLGGLSSSCLARPECSGA